MKKKVLILTSGMPLGGAAMFVLNLCDGLRSINSNWSAVAGVFTDLGSVGLQTLEAGHEVIGPCPKPMIHEDAMRFMYDKCSHLRPDAVVANLSGDSFDFLRFVPSGILRIGVIHSDDNSVYPMVRFYADWLDVVVAVSKHTQQRFYEITGNCKVPVVNISCGIPLSLKIRGKSSSGTLRVLYLGRISEDQKRVSRMARIIRKSIERISLIEWTLIGDGPQFSEMRASLADLSNVHFTGALAYDQARAAIPDHDVYFLCSDFEGLPLSMLEAMSAGLVPVVSDLPSGIPEVVHDGNGIRIPPDQEDEFVEALLRLASNPDQLESLSRQARNDVVKHYSNEAMAHRWTDLLDHHVKPSMGDWTLPQHFTVPSILRKSILHHPWFRPLRRLLKQHKSKQ